MAWSRWEQHTGPPLTSDKKKVLAIDSHPANISRGIPADFGLVGEAQTVLAELVSRLDTSAPRESWSAGCELAAQWRQRLQSELEEAPLSHPGRAIRVLSEYADEGAVFCLDAG